MTRGLPWSVAGAIRSVTRNDLSRKRLGRANSKPSSRPLRDDSRMARLQGHPRGFVVNSLRIVGGDITGGGLWLFEGERAICTGLRSPGSRERRMGTGSPPLGVSEVIAAGRPSPFSALARCVWAAQAHFGGRIAGLPSIR